MKQHYTTQHANSALKGVNLGGWLVLEKWMTPSVFAGSTAVNEYELSHTKVGRAAIKRHRSTFIKESDFAWLASVGIEIIRVPIGYWAVQVASPYCNAAKELAWCMQMAKKYRLKVLLCMHAAPGAQNANDHSGSGKPGKVGWYTRANKKATQLALVTLADKYGSHPALWGIELLNEPLVANWWQRVQLWWWTYRAARVLRRILPPRVRIVASDCYDPAWWSGKIGKATLDIHHYQCFSDEDTAADSYQHHHTQIHARADAYSTYVADQPIIIGEWSATLPPRTMNDEDARRFCRTQLAVPVGVDAWFFWSYKTEHAGTWNFRDLYEKGYFNGFL